MSISRPRGKNDANQELGRGRTVHLLMRAKKISAQRSFIASRKDRSSHARRQVDQRYGLTPCAHPEVSSLLREKRLGGF